MPHRTFAVVVLWGMLLLARAAQAEPYLAVREGYNCSGCHTNVTGGGKRSDIPTIHAHDILHYPNWFGKFSNPTDPFTGEVNKYISLGGDLRVSNVATFQDQGANGRVNNNTAFRGRLQTDTLDVNEAETYLELRLIPEMLTFYLDQEFAPSTDTREVFGLLRGLPFNGFVKAGRMFLPYGLQLLDDTAFIRGGRNGSSTTNFSFNTRQAAFEVGVEPGPYSAIFAVSNGASGDRDVWVSGTVSAMWTEVPVVRNVFLGGSAAHMGGSVDNVEFCFFGGSNLGPLTGLGEVDFLETNTATAGQQGTFIGYGELDYLLMRWLNLKSTVSYSDDDGDLTSRANDSENVVTVGLEPFLNRFVQTRLTYSVSNGVESKPNHNQDLWIAELHLFF